MVSQRRAFNHPKEFRQGTIQGFISRPLGRSSRLPVMEQSAPKKSSATSAGQGSLPRGPPVPIEMADEIGLSDASFGSTRLRPSRIASRVSGIPWPRIFAEP
jgi:hypothetical protein